VRIPHEKFKIVGRPEVELITPAQGPIRTIHQPTVLYAPTWQGPFADSRVYSLPAGRQIVEQLLAHGARVIFRAHPFNYRYPDAEQMISDIGAVLDADREVSGREHLWGAAAELQMSVEDCFNASDAMVSDVSAVVSDYLHSGKPFAIVSVGRTPEQLLVDVPAARAAYVIRDDLSNLAEVCDDLLRTDPLDAVRQETKIYYLGDFPDQNYADGFLNAAREVIDAGRRTAVDVA
jgi:CDP-glycerol glycerophosphotransferase (TagB/SpsB family)